MKVSAFAVILK